MFKAFVIAMLFVACATGGSPDQTKTDASVRYDSQNVVPRDAAVTQGDAHLIDAFVFHDAPPSPDAPAGGGVCSDNTQCHAAGECCFVAICVPGTAVGANVCFPN
jgi:hypothetical protein